MKWLVTIQDDDAKNITFEIEAARLTWADGVAIFDVPGTPRPVFAIASFRLTRIENAGDAA